MKGAIKSSGHSHMECGGKRSATPLWLVFVPYPSQDAQAKAASRFALPPHSIKSWTVTDSLKTPVLAAFIQKSREGVCSPCPEPVQCFNDCQTRYPMPGCA